MANVLIVAYLLIVVALVAVILLQRSEGGGLGMGGGAGGFMTVRGSANVLTRTTGVLAALFFATAIGLTILNSVDHGTQSILDRAASAANAAKTAPASTNVLDALNKVQQQAGGAVTAPTTATPAPAQDAPDLALPAATTPAATTPAAATTAPATSTTTTTPPAAGTTPAPVQPATN